VNKIWNTPETRNNKYFSSAGRAHLLHNGKTPLTANTKSCMNQRQSWILPCWRSSSFPRRVGYFTKASDKIVKYKIIRRKLTFIIMHHTINVVTELPK